MRPLIGRNDEVAPEGPSGLKPRKCGAVPMLRILPTALEIFLRPGPTVGPACPEDIKEDLEAAKERGFLTRKGALQGGPLVGGGGHGLRSAVDTGKPAQKWGLCQALFFEPIGTDENGPRRAPEQRSENSVRESRSSRPIAL